MKLRKSLVAVATALTVATAGTVVANAETGSSELTSSSFTPYAAEGENPGDDPAGENGGDETPDNNGSSTDSENDTGSSINWGDPVELKSWIGVFTAVITALGAAFSFITKYFL